MNRGRSLHARQATSGARWHVTLRILHDYRAELAALNVTPLQAATVLYLQYNPGSYVSHCAKGVGMTALNMKDILKRMKLKGWLRKQRAPEDDRYVRLTLTPNGAALVSKITHLLHAARAISTQYTLTRHAARTPGQ